MDASVILAVIIIVTCMVAVVIVFKFILIYIRFHAKHSSPFPHFEEKIATSITQEKQQPRQTEAKSRPLEPKKRGGRPRKDTKEQTTQKLKHDHHPELEIICCKKERQWILAVEVPKELLEKPDLRVFQNGSSLGREESEDACWRLEQASGEVVVRWNEDEAIQEAKIKLGQNGYLLFKLSGRNLDQGQLVKFPSSGAYLVIAPGTWERDEKLSGLPPAMPEPVSLDGYKAHFFDLEKSGDGKIAFHLPNGRPLVIKTKAPYFELVGRQLEDASEYMGPLFVGSLPQIKAPDAQAWRHVKTIVVGEEGSGQKRWRAEFIPNPDQMVQDLPSEVAVRKSGWYFLRFYDANDDLIESLDFRFIDSLKHIALSESRPLPTEGGYRLVYVEFLHEPDCVVQPVEPPANIQLDRQREKTIGTIPPDPTCDQSRWSVCPRNGSPVEVVILVERIWWALAREDHLPSQWTDKPIELSYKDFAATSNQALWVRLPKRRWVNNVEVGFANHKARRFPVKVSQKAIAIPLRDFGDAQELSEVGTVPLYVWTTLVAKVIVKACCTFCDFSSSQEEDVISHVESSHLDEVIPSLTYQEMREHDPSLPPEIYKCAYCDYYVAANDPINNPTSGICNHIEKECTKAPRGQGPTPISFTVIDDVDEIRENVIKSLPRIYK